MKLSDIVEICGGTLSLPGKATTVQGISTDSRTVGEGDCFFALRGERFDAHEFLQEVERKGAAAAVVEQKGTLPTQNLPLIQVSDTLMALQMLANSYRASFNIPVAAVAGSNGKTTTKEFTAAVFGARYHTARTQGNLNNHIGVPLTLLSLESGHEAAVVELGTNHPGEIELLARMTNPTIGILTNIGWEHLEFFKDEESVAQEEGMLLEVLERDHIAILNADDPWTDQLLTRTRAKVMLAGFDESADVRITGLNARENEQIFEVTYQEKKCRFEIPFPGRHMVSNAALAIAAGLCLEISLEEMVKPLKHVVLPKGRMRLLKMRGIVLIDDCYNANPSSMQVALKQLAEYQGRKIAVLGTMGELGAEEAQWHQRMGELAAELKIDVIVPVGKYALHYARGYDRNVETFQNNEAATAFLKNILKSGDTLLVKASRAAKFEQIVAGLGFESGKEEH